MLPFVAVGGVLIVRKIHRGRMMVNFFAAVATSTIVVNALTHHNILANLQTTALHSSLFFLAFVMLTEPLTSPATKDKQTWYGILAGLLFPPQIHLFSVYSTPELSLLVANVFSYIVSPRQKLLPKLSQKVAISPNSADFVFQLERPINFKPGQYMEWTLPHQKPDSRGNRRYFTLASAPTEDNIRLGVKFYRKGSSYKRAMLAMDARTPIAAGQLGGDFVLPNDRSQKLVFIAGGIGITPYRSMVKYMLDTNDRRNVTMLYSERNAQGLAYTDVFAAAERKLGIKVVYTLTDSKAAPPNWRGKTGYISARMLAAEVPDYKERLFYVSGPQSMVTTIKNELRGLGVAHHHIKTDFFPGYI
jgi:ferredoxin-NADP reductase